MNLKRLLKLKVIAFITLLLISTASYSLDLTPSEKQWITDHPVVVLGADEAWPPFDFKNSKGQHAGIAADMLDYISKQTGLKFDIKTGVWSDIMKEMKAGKLDGLTCAASTENRKEFLLFSSPLVSVPLAIIVNKNRNDISGISDLDGKKVAVTKDSYLHDLIEKNFPKIKLVLTASNEESVEAVSFNEVDAYIGNIGVASYIINEKLYANLKIVAKFDKYKTEPAIAISKKHSILAGIIEKTLQSMPPSQKLKITQKWFEPSSDRTIALTEEEIEWIKNHPKVIIGGGYDWAPFDFTSKEGLYQGVAKDYLDLIAQKTGLNFEVHLDIWRNNLKKLETGKVDLLGASYEVSERKKYTIYSDPYFEMLDYIFLRKDVQAKTINDLNGKVVAIPIG